MFNENSGLVRLWVYAIRQGKYAIEQIPDISNLKEVVEGLITQ